MAQEIERKFILPAIPEGLSIIEKKVIFQSYLALGKEEVRIRKIEYENKLDQYYLTYKNRLKGKFSREEIEIEIGKETYEQLANKAIPLIKERNLIGLEGKLFAEADVYLNAGFELKTVEVEFSSVEAALGFNPPEWFGRELTGAAEFGNQYLFELINGIKNTQIDFK